MKYPILLTSDGRYQTILNHAYNIIIEDEILSTSGGYETLTFNISNDDARRYDLKNERMVEVDKRVFVIRLLEDVKGDLNICTVTCDALWYDLNDGELRYLMHTESAETLDATTAISDQISNTDWHLGTINITSTRERRTADEKQTSLYNLRQIASIYGGELKFDTQGRSVSLLADMGERHQEIFCYEKNTTSIKRSIDTRSLYTRFTLKGKDGITISSINDGVEYLENYSWYDNMILPRKIKSYEKQDDRFTNSSSMKEYMEQWLDVYSKPIISYELSVSLFDFTPNLGDYIFVYDRDMKLGDWLRVMSRKRNILQPHLSTIELESTKKTIVETIVSNTITTTEVQEAQVNGNQVLLPEGEEGYVMQYKSGKWKATNIIGDINKVLDSINGEEL